MVRTREPAGDRGLPRGARSRWGGTRARYRGLVTSLRNRGKLTGEGCDNFQSPIGFFKLDNMSESYTPNAFNLRDGNPFTYDARSISTASSTMAFKTGIDARNRGQCIVCGLQGDGVLEHAHIIPQVENQTVCSHILLKATFYNNSQQWQYLMDTEFIPRLSKSVAHESRNGILMCRNHHSMFDSYSFFIRWIPEVCLCLLPLASLITLMLYLFPRTALPVYSHKPLSTK